MEFRLGCELYRRKFACGNWQRIAAIRRERETVRVDDIHIGIVIIGITQHDGRWDITARHAEGLTLEDRLRRRKPAVGSGDLKTPGRLSIGCFNACGVG